MPSATPDMPLPPQAPRKFTSWCAGVFIFVMFMLAFADVEKINDLILVMKLCYKYGVTFLTWFVWIAWKMVVGIAYIINISSWQLLTVIGIFVVCFSYVVYQLYLKCMMTVKVFGTMIVDLFVTSLRTFAMATIASIVVGIVAFGIYYFA
jgi:hypothetical protein